MTPELARIALQFLERTDLKGAETDAMYAVRQALMMIWNQPQIPSGPQHHPAVRPNGADDGQINTAVVDEDHYITNDHLRRKQ